MSAEGADAHGKLMSRLQGLVGEHHVALSRVLDTHRRGMTLTLRSSFMRLRLTPQNENWARIVRRCQLWPASTDARNDRVMGSFGQYLIRARCVSQKRVAALRLLMQRL